AGGRQRDGEGVQLRGLRQLAVQEQVRDLLERGPARQLVDVVADVGEATVLAVEVAEAGLGGDDTLESADQRAVFLRHGRPSRGREVGLDGIPRDGAAASTRGAPMKESGG